MKRLVFSLLALGACGPRQAPTAAEGSAPRGAAHSKVAPSAAAPPPATAAPTTAAPWTTEASNRANRCVLRMFSALAKSERNLAVATTNVLTALNMVRVGARGDTSTNLDASLGLQGNDGSSLEQALKQLRADSHQAGIELMAATSLFVEQGFALNPAYVQQMRSDYAAEPVAVAFSSDSESARGKINVWAAEHTDHRIEELLPKDSVGPSTRLVIGSAVALSAKWKAAFDPAQTAQGTFHTPSGDVQVPLMHRAGTVSLADVDGITLIELPYSGDRLVFNVVLPSEGRALKEVTRRLDDATLRSLASKLTPQSVRLSLPRFTVQGESFELTTALREMGVDKLFSSQANLSGIAGKPGDLSVSSVYHSVFVRVDESGTEAAGATAVVMNRSADRRRNVVVDRPFMFLIRDRATGIVIFAGQVYRPVVDS